MKELLGMECTAAEHVRLRAPKRIQRMRTLGWRMPEGAVYVGRPTKFGNPYWDVRRYGLDLCIRLFRETATGCWDPSIIPRGEFSDLWEAWIYSEHCAWLKRIGHHPVEEIRSELRGKDLACWCSLMDKDGKPTQCHADILLEIANG